MNTALKRVQTNTMKTGEKLHQCSLPKEVINWLKVHAKDRKRFLKEVYWEAAELQAALAEKQIEAMGFAVYYSPQKEAKTTNIVLDMEKTEVLEEIATKHGVSIRIFMHTALLRYYLQKTKILKPSDY